MYEAWRSQISIFSQFNRHPNFSTWFSWTPLSPTLVEVKESFEWVALIAFWPLRGKKVEIKALIHPNGHKKRGIAAYLKPTMPPICMSSQSSEIRFWASVNPVFGGKNFGGSPGFRSRSATGGHALYTGWSNWILFAVWEIYFYFSVWLAAFFSL